MGASGEQPSQANDTLSGERRVAWLLSTSRTLGAPGADGRHADPAAFAAALARAGCAATPDDVRAWESGSRGPSRAALAAYEQVLGLRPIHLSSVVDVLRLLADDPLSWSAEGDDRRPHFDAERRDLLVRLAATRAARPGDYAELVRGLTTSPALSRGLGEDDWRMLTRRVVDLLPRCVKLGYTQQIAAAMGLCALPVAQEPLADAIRAYLAVPHVQVTMNPLGLLDRIPTRSAAALVLDLLERPPSRAIERMCVWLAAQKLKRGDLTGAERARLDYIVLAAWRRDADRASRDMAELVAALPPGLRSTLTNAARRAGSAGLHETVTTGWEPHTPSYLRQLGWHTRRALDAVAGRAAPDDPVLGQLFKEALMHRDSERRHVASVTLAASAFAGAIGDEALSCLGESGLEPALRRRLAVLVRYVVQPEHRMRIVPFTSDDEELVAVPLLQAIGHLPLAADSDLRLRSGLRREANERERARLYALGMTGSPVLPTLADAAGTTSWQRGGARWWLAMGPAVHG